MILGLLDILEGLGNFKIPFLCAIYISVSIVLWALFKWVESFDKFKIPVEFMEIYNLVKHDIVVFWIVSIPVLILGILLGGMFLIMGLLIFYLFLIGAFISKKF